MQPVLSLIRGIMRPLLNSVYATLPLRPHLREMRLCTLQAGSWAEGINCSLEVVALGMNPEFEAISYVWGNSPNVLPITLNGHVIHINENLVSVFRHLRQPTKARVLWVDAVCIDQGNIQERNSQVSLMRDIYFQCKRGLIWIGDVESSKANASSRPPASFYEWLTDFSDWGNSSALDKDDSTRISDFETKLKTYYRLPFALRHGLVIDSIQGAYCFLNLLASDIPFLSNHDAFRRIIIALHKIMSSAWWVRQWVIQELALPPQVNLQYGNIVASWDLFSRAARNYDHHRKECCKDHYDYLHWNDVRHMEHFSRTVVELDDLRQEWQKIRNGKTEERTDITLRQLLWQFREKDTSDPRDKVFALYTLVNSWGKQMPMRPEYSWTTRQVYRAVVDKVITIDGSLMILMGNTHKTQPSLPTWVPDWTNKSPKFELERLERSQLFNASAGLGPLVRFLDESFMELAGVSFDVVTSISEIMKYDDEDDTREIFGSWYALVCKHQPMGSKYLTGETIMEAYWRTLCIDTTRNLNRETASLEKTTRYERCSGRYVQECRKQWMDHKGLPLYRNEPTYNEQLSFVAVDFAIASATLERRLFFTKSGYMGLGPSCIREGDTIYVLFGGHTPFIVRSAGQKTVPFEEPQSCHELVGDCYVHGIMDGEAMEDYENHRQNIYLV